MPDMNKLSNYATTVCVDAENRTISVVYHSTEIVRVDCGCVILNTDQQ